MLLLYRIRKKYLSSEDYLHIYTQNVAFCRNRERYEDYYNINLDRDMVITNNIIHLSATLRVLLL
jgi:hypothetical protein